MQALHLYTLSGCPVTLPLPYTAFTIAVPHVLHHVCHCVFTGWVGLVGMGRFRSEFATGLRQFDKRTCAAVWGGF